ncbi:hypothetical protein L207DRAFT_424534 [Hyaloscypha variabilis F]|uniref:Zn(2)-C6 fungal-type domain-containing protein n=1 Tax=Hyaloscypha variabilis (strain UAMH 11265 / GT02V1 / F) TaxID=1149755 RepID=A0A2J6RW70_HYAVF|nr:hypothetical protein L207DRAFT_424534 [Hyaloscypha variabilis F]
MESRRSVDGSESSSSAVTVVTSATSSCTDPWSSSISNGGWVEEEEEDDWDHECEAQRGDDDMMLVPKLEPMDDIDMADLSDVKEGIIPETPETSSSTSTPAQVKRPRGRPRKHPKPSPEALAKVAKGRSKTGCITCRRRKKKCDETKPGCTNCEKNSVICEGYPEKTTWKSGKEKGEEARLRRATSITISTMQLPYLVHGVETEGDRMFLHHYISRLSSIFTLEGENDSAFRNILLPMAQQHSGLMHSILALSSKHIDYTSPYGLQILHEHPNVDVKMLEERSQFHHDEAFKELTCRKSEEVAVSPATYAQMICFVLQTLSDKKPNGSHRLHLQYYQKLIQENPPAEETEFTKFIHEFFQYHICADQLIHLPQGDVHFVSIPDDWNLPTTVLQPSAVRLLGVFDGLFLYMSKITNLRNKIRHNMEHNIDPVIDYRAFYAAAEIDAGIREWTPAWPAGDPRDAAGMLYRQMMWIYLWRTINPPQVTNWKPDPKNKIKQAVDDGLELLSRFGARDPSQTLILAPAFVIGCAAFEEYQREPIRKAISVVKSYMEYKNTDTALEVLEEVWRLMDAHDEQSWDWQSIAHRMGMDFLAT